MKKTKVKVIEYRGITLMSLVITVIVLLILAGISIGMISGENGILNKARKSKNSIDEATTLEYIKTSIAASRTPDNDVNEQTLQKELDKFFDKSEIIVVNENDYMINVNDKIYNYSNGEVTSGYELKTSTNGIIEASKDPKIVSSKIYGNSIQDGDPSPDSPVEIQSVGDLVTEGEYKDKYKIPVTVSGKNIFDIDAVSGNVIANGSVEEINNGWKAKGSYGGSTNAAAFSNGWLRPGTSKGSIYISAGQKVTISADVKLIKASDNYKDNNNIRIYLYSTTNNNYTSNSQTFSSSNTTRVKQTYTVEVSGNYYPIFTLQDNELEITNIQIETGDKNTDFEAYQKPQVNNIYLDQPLRKVGDYADYIDLNNKKIIRNVKHIEFSGNEDWSKYVSVDKHYQFMVKDNKFSDSTNLVLSNYYKADKATGGYFSGKDYAVISVDGSRIRFKDKDISSVDEWKAKLQTYFNNGNSLKTDYVLVSSTEEDIDVDIPDMLNAIKGTKILAINTKVQPDNIETIYYN